jgi:hypothetical protein
MAANIIYEPGYNISVVASHPASPVSGGVCIYGDLAGIAEIDENATTGETTVNFGPWIADLPVTDSITGGIAKGAPLFASKATPVVISNDSTGVFLGYANETVGDSATATIEVIHPPMIGGIMSAGAIGATQLANGAVITTKILAANVTAPKLSGTANTRPVIIPLGAVSATTSQIAFVAPCAGVINSVKLVNKNAVTADDTNYWTFTLTDKGTGAGTGKIVEKSTKSTGGSALAAYVALSLGTPDTTHKIMAIGDVVLFTATKTASATALAEAALLIEFLPTEA